ncbi:MAG: helix-turn-helix transcriptional regulator [Rhizobiales bacterium]|nr:helix-turn-helix transcriptional regulator [Hyphomicrobiales bacterium]
MTIATTVLASGRGWRLSDVVCAAGPGDRPFEERHDWVSLAAVLSGVFAYRASHGAALLTPGAVLLGNCGACFQCGHEHAQGDRCLSLQFAPDYWERLVAALPGARRAAFDRPGLPPLESLLPAAAALIAARDLEADGVEQAAIDFADAVLRAGEIAPLREPAPRAARRVCDAVRRIEAHVGRGEQAVPLDVLAAEAGVDRFHFLRSFRAAVGVTPHQYLLRLRLGRAAERLRRNDEPVTRIAFDCGFGDLSTFNRRFRRVMGASPLDWRRRARRSCG